MKILVHMIPEHNAMFEDDTACGPSPNWTLSAASCHQHPGMPPCLLDKHVLQKQVQGLQQAPPQVILAPLGSACANTNVWLGTCQKLLGGSGGLRKQVGTIKGYWSNIGIMEK